MIDSNKLIGHAGYYILREGVQIEISRTEGKVVIEIPDEFEFGDEKAVLDNGDIVSMDVAIFDGLRKVVLKWREDV
jgi:hypothetical protein